MKRNDNPPTVLVRGYLGPFFRKESSHNCCDILAGQLTINEKIRIKPLK
jgi:hypothetical protein